jgi:excisionase family DNA binding protein
MTVAEAAELLGISEGAVRKRVERKKLDADHGPDGRLIVYPDPDATVQDASRDSRATVDDRYTQSLEDQVKYLRSQLDQERDANRENRRIIAVLTSRVPELEAATSSGAQDPDPPAGPTRTPADAGEGPQTGAQRPWWRRMFRG